MKNNLIIFCLMNCFSVYALDLKTVQLSTLQHLPLIEASEFKVDSFESDVVASRGAFDTKLKFKSRNNISNKYDNQNFETSLVKQTPYWGAELFAGHRQGTGVFPLYEGKYTTTAAGELFAGLSLPLLRNRSIDSFRLELQTSQFREKIAQHELRLKQLVYLQKSTEKYWSWVGAVHKLKIQEELFKIAQERHVFLEKQFKAGDLGKIKLNDNLRTIAKRQADFIEAQRELYLKTRELSLYYRDENAQPVLPTREQAPETFPAPIKIPETDLKKLHLAIPTLPSVQMIDLQLSALDLEKDFFSNQRLPKLNLALQGVKELGEEPTARDPQAIQVGVMFEYPLENRKATGKEQSVNAKYLSLGREKNWLVNELNILAENALTTVNLTHDVLMAVKDEIKNTKIMAEAERTRFKSGDSNLFVVNIREQDEADARIKEIKAEINHLLSLNELQTISMSILNELTPQSKN